MEKMEGIIEQMEAGNEPGATNEENTWGRVKRWFMTLVRGLDADELGDYLIQGQIISAEQLDIIKSQYPTKQGRCRELLLFLMRTRNPGAHKVFIDALEDNPQWHWIAEKINGQQIQVFVKEQKIRMDEMKENIEHLNAERERLLMKLKDHELKDEEQKLKMEEMQKTINQLEAEKELLGSRLEHYETPEKVKYADTPELVLTITTNDPLKKGQVIFGLAVLGNELFVAYSNSSEIEVYNAVTRQLERIVKLPNVKELYDLTAGKTDNCLFALILTKQTEISENMQNQDEEYVIIKFDVKGNLVHPWSTPIGRKYGHLSTCESNLVVCYNSFCIIEEFSCKGDLIRQVQFPPSAGISFPWHAIKVTRMHYAVCHQGKEDKLHAICLVDLGGNIKMECRGLDKETSTPCKTPTYFIEDRNRYLLVADQDNNRILLLDWKLKFRRILIQLGGGQFPNRLCFDETQSKLFVSIYSCVTDDKGKMKNGVLVYNIK